MTRATAIPEAPSRGVVSLYRYSGLRLLCAALIAAVVLCSSGGARAQPYPVPPTWGGDILDRPRLLGDWSGLRDDLGRKGIVLDIDALLTPQTVLSGGRNTGGNFWGNLDYTLNIDTQKAGLWPGGFLKLQADTGFGSNAYRDSGGIIPINAAALIPGPNNRTTALMNASLTQFLSPQFGAFLGKINTIDSSATEFYGDYRTQFQNAAFNFPMSLEQVPISTFGGGLIAIPQEDILLSATVLGANGKPDSNDPGEAFNGVMVLGTGELKVKPWGLAGHHAVNIEWNDKKRFSLNQDPSNLATLLLQERFPRLASPGPVLTQIIARFFPNLLVPVQPANRETSSWAVTYAFDQYFWQPDGDPKHGVGLFFAFGASDGNPNPIQYSFLTGIGGKGVVPGRPDDTFGIGLARTEFSDALLPLLRQRLDLGLRHEDAVEMYYNAAITGWLNLTADLQIVKPALTRALNEDGRLAHVDTALVLGTRLRVRF